MDSFEGDKNVPEQVETFKVKWNRYVEKLDKSSLTPEGKLSIWNTYQIEKSKLETSFAEWEHTPEVENILASLDSKLQLALEIAESKYQETEKPVKISKFNAIKSVGDAITNLFNRIFGH